MKYNPGDLVWARIDHMTAWAFDISAGEYAAVVLSHSLLNDRYECGKPLYDIGFTPPPAGLKADAIFCACNLRPRRDDYQQKEDTGSRDEITRPRADDPLHSITPTQPVEV